MLGENVKWLLLDIVIEFKQAGKPLSKGRLPNEVRKRHSGILRVNFRLHLDLLENEGLVQIQPNEFGYHLILPTKNSNKVLLKYWREQSENLEKLLEKIENREKSFLDKIQIGIIKEE